MTSIAALISVCLLPLYRIEPGRRQEQEKSRTLPLASVIPTVFFAAALFLAAVFYHDSATAMPGQTDKKSVGLAE